MGLKWNGGDTSLGMCTSRISLYCVRFRLAASTMASRSASGSSMPDSCSASVTIANVMVCVPASCMRAQTMPGASVVPSPMLAKWVMKRRRVSKRSAMRGIIRYSAAARTQRADGNDARLR